MDDFFKNKKILVAGATGFISTNMVIEFLKRGAKIRGTIHSRAPFIKDESIEYLNVDLTLKADCLKAVEGMDYVIMCAANTAGAGVMEKTPLALVSPNVVMNTFMLEAAYEAGVKKFLFLSSNAVYPPYEYPVKEDEMMSGPPFEKYYPISWMKRFTEILCETYSQRIKKPMAAVVIRPANTYGPYDDFDWESSHMVPALIRKVVELKDPIEVWGDGTEIKDLIYVDDFVRGALLALEKIETYDPINIGTGVPVSVNDVLHFAIEAEGYTNAKIVYNTSKPTMIPKRLLDVSKGEHVLGFKAETSLQDGIRKTIAWYKKAYPNGYK